MWKRLVKLRAYLIFRQAGVSFYSTFFLLGCRKKIIFLRIRSATVILKKAVLFLSLSKLNFGELWLWCHHAHQARLARSMDVWVVFSFNKHGFVIFWRQRYFWVRLRTFTYSLYRFLGVDVFLVLQTNTPGFGGLDRLMGGLVPSVTISNLQEDQASHRYQLYTNTRSMRLVLFYFRTLLLSR